MIKLQNVYQAGKIAAGAVEFLFELIQERMTEPEVNISATMPTIEQHRQFVHRRPYRAWYLIENDDGERVGYVSVTDRNEIGIVLLKAHRRKGYGSAAVLELMRQVEPLPPVPSVRRGAWIANINPANKASIAMFESLGARHIQNTYEVPSPAEQKS